MIFTLIPGLLVFGFREKLSRIAISGSERQIEPDNASTFSGANVLMLLRLFICGLGAVYITRGVAMVVQNLVMLPALSLRSPMDVTHWVFLQLALSIITLAIGSLLVFKNSQISDWLAKKSQFGPGEEER